jgi:hypothetical protein
MVSRLRSRYATPAQRMPAGPFYQLLKPALQTAAPAMRMSSELRDTILNICDGRGRGTDLESFLAAFTVALVEASIDVGMPPGPERNDFLSLLVRVCAEHLYSKGKAPPSS